MQLAWYLKALFILSTLAWALETYVIVFCTWFYYSSVINCTDLEAPTNGTVTGKGSFGSVVTYSCDTGFILSGDTNRTCQADGAFTGSAPVCTSTWHVILYIIVISVWVYNRGKLQRSKVTSQWAHKTLLYNCKHAHKLCLVTVCVHGLHLLLHIPGNIDSVLVFT